MAGQFLRTVLVGDSPGFIRAVCDWIESEQGLIVVATVDNGFASLIAVDVLRPDLVLLVAGTPGMDGVEATRRIKSRPEPPAVVLITRHAPADFAQRARDAGADAVISNWELGESAEFILCALGTRTEATTPPSIGA